MAKKLDTQFETFKTPDAFSLSSLKQDEPSSFNGMTRVKRYRITVEEIDEPKEVIAERLRDLLKEATIVGRSRRKMEIVRYARKHGIDLESKGDE